jgi:hypothetical protein
MTTGNRVFVVAKEDLRVGDTLIRKQEVGIIQGELTDEPSVFFVVSGQSVMLTHDMFDIFDVTKTGDNFPNKVCNICHRLLPTPNFSRNQNGINNRIIRRPSCDECRVILDGVSAPAAEKRKWEITRPELEPFRCPICKKTTIPGLTSKVVLDHDHETGRIRGWICDSCNTGIGRFKDNITLLENAIRYLKTK